MIHTTYYLDKRKAYKAFKSVPIIAEVHFDQNGTKQEFKFSTGIKCGQQNFRDQKIRTFDPYSKRNTGEVNGDDNNLQLTRIKNITEKIYNEGLTNGRLLSIPDWKSEIKRRLTSAETEKGLLDYFDDYLANLRVKGKSPSFISAMESLGDHLKEMDEKGYSISFKSIDALFETKFRESLMKRGVRSPKGTKVGDYESNTINAWVKRLKIFMNWALKGNFHSNFSYKNYTLHETSKPIIALTEEEVTKIFRLKIPTHKHIRFGGTSLIRDWFIISTQTGLRYSDFHKVSESELQPVKDGFNLHIKTKKTGAEVVIPVSDLLFKTLEKYDFKVPSPPSNQKYNEGLERIRGLVKLNKPITSHTGRKTLCTTWYRSGIPVPQIMKVSGHRTEKEFYRYIGVGLEENASMIRKKSGKFRIPHKAKMAVNQ